MEMFAEAKNCIVRDYGSTSIVCVCNATYCDSLDPISDESITSGSFIHYSSTQSGQRLQPNKGVFSNNLPASDSIVSFTISKTEEFQSIFGFGAALTDSTALNIKNLSDAASESLLQTYFGEGGAQLLFLRIPMGASDFSLRPYTYDDIEGDVTLEHFALIDNDYDYKIPILNRATEIRGQELKLFTSPWSAPWWMKINGTTGISHLAEEYYQVWADYFVKYFDAYAQQGISFWGYSPQNEPIQGSDHAAKIISMGWTKESQTPWIADYLGPTMEKGGYGDLKMMILDDNRSRLPGWAETVFANPVAKSYVAGTAVHWYTDEGIRPSVLTQTHELDPNKFIFYTEACQKNVFKDAHDHAITVDGYRYVELLNDFLLRWAENHKLGQILIQLNWATAHAFHQFRAILQPVFPATKIVREDLGKWEIGERYGTSMIQAFNNWVVGWTDWNMAINEQGGPATFGYNAAIIVNATADEFYKQPPYYFQAHFSMFIPPDSKHVSLTSDNDGGLLNVAFITPETDVVVILMNSQNVSVSVVISDQDRGYISVDVEARSINTIIYR
ncbi:unnamed protein product [Timema podura]|uniref:Glucosylceramidase n=1 Tax=Timema podura TaxID=61482 RepID=A0ABN7NK21_TIMPD|nr:unnamed protein product [Timema podura]